ncbi:MAG: hypothetical protein ABSA92_06155 [Candidatus Bathyarchaeia archaeon]
MSTVREDKHFLGRHTALSLIKQKPDVWRRIPYVKENDGHAPPLVLAVGDRRRVYAIARRFRNPVLLPEAAAKLSVSFLADWLASATGSILQSYQFLSYSLLRFL